MVYPQGKEALSTPVHALTIRDATPSDVVAMAELLNQLNRAEGRPEVTDAMKLGAALFGEQRKIDLSAILAISKEEIVGLVLYYMGYDVLTASYGYHLADFVVGELHRRRGVGQALFAHLAAQNLAQGGKWISLTALNHNAPAKAFYASLGMVQVAVDFFAIGPMGLHAVTKKFGNA
jgi:ribosomal protein S18 acetylase RimI-like enzyme